MEVVLTRDLVIGRSNNVNMSIGPVSGVYADYIIVVNMAKYRYMNIIITCCQSNFVQLNMYSDMLDTNLETLLRQTQLHSFLFFSHMLYHTKTSIGDSRISNNKQVQMSALF